MYTYIGMFNIPIHGPYRHILLGLKGGLGLGFRV